MKPLSDFTTPRTLMALISRHFLPVAQPEPDCWTTGLKKGSRLPLIAHFFSSGLGCLGASAILTGVPCVAVGLAATTVLGCCLLSAFTGVATGFAGATLVSATFATVTALAAGAFTSATFGARASAGVFVAGTAGFTGAGAFLATAVPASCVCRINTVFPAGPGVTSYGKAFSRSTTTLVVGGVLPSMPIRIPLTPLVPTGILFCELPKTVSGSSTTMRAGELSLLTRGVTAWLEVISI